MSRRNDPSEPQWYRHQHVPSMLLEIPIRDLPAVVGCLVLGTLYGLLEDVLPQETGTALAISASRPLRGKVPGDLMRVMTGMDEIDWYGSFPKDEHRAQYIGLLITRVSAVLQKLPDTNYDLRWVIESDPLARDEEFFSPELNRYYESVGEEEVLQEVGSCCYSIHLARVMQTREGIGWATTRQVISFFLTVSPDEVQRRLQSLRDGGYLEMSPDGKQWRPTESGWEEIDRLEEQSR